MFTIHLGSFCLEFIIDFEKVCFCVSFITNPFAHIVKHTSKCEESITLLPVEPIPLFTILIYMIYTSSIGHGQTIVIYFNPFCACKSLYT